MPPRTPAFWQRRGMMSAALSPAAWIYRAASNIRARTVVPQTAAVPVVCVGNATAGGAGKTPTVMALIEILQRMGKTSYALSRGYGGHHAGPLIVDPALHTAQEVGDEPLLLAAHMPTVVARDRVAGAHFAVQCGAEVIVMDDGFQNPSLVKDFSLLVIDAAYGFGNGMVLPAGPLREPAEDAIARADAVLVIGEEYAVKHPLVWHAALVPDAAALALRGKKVAAFAGLARPEKFRRTLEQIGCEVVRFDAFPDHHFYREQELYGILQCARREQAVMVTTAKDAVRLAPAWRPQVAVVGVTLEIAEKNAVETALRKIVS